MRISILLLLIFCSSIISAQSKIKDFEYYNLTDKKDNIDFVVYKSQADIKKPILLFCQGSQPVPLFLKMYDDTLDLSLSNFDLNYLSKDYHVVVISRPFTPVIADTSQINYAYNYVTDKYNNPHSYDTLYLKNDTKEITARRANKVWKFLKKQEWVDKSNFIIAGHSQGSREAVEIASTNKDVTMIGLFGFSPNGRYEESIYRNRKMAEKGEITWEEADSLNIEQLDFYKRTLDDYENLKRPYLYSWKSFNEPNLDKLLKLKIPIYVAYGSEDIVSINCDFLPFEFAKEGKTNLTLKRYGGLEHNFFPVKDDGFPDYKKPNWIEVMNRFIDWSINQSSH